MLRVIVGEERKEDAPHARDPSGGAALHASLQDDAAETSSRVYLARALSENSPQLPTIASYDFHPELLDNLCDDWHMHSPLSEAGLRSKAWEILWEAENFDAPAFGATHRPRTSRSPLQSARCSST